MRSSLFTRRALKTQAAHLALNRRQFLASGLKASAITGIGLSGLLSQAHAANTPYEGHFVLFCTFDGGWDQLLAADPKDQTDKAYGPSKAINPGYDLIKDSDSAIEYAVDELTGGSGVFQPQGSKLTVGPAMTKLASEHWQDLCLVRGMDMGTLTHAVGRRYFLTGKFPRGLQASGASLTTVATAGLGDNTPLANLVFGMETFNDGQPTWASGLSVRQPLDILSVLSSLSAPLNSTAHAALDQYLASALSQHAEKLNADGNIDAFLANQLRAQTLSSGFYAEHFDYLNPTASTQQVLNSFGIASNSDMESAKGQAFMAAQAITQGVAQCVSVRMAVGLDTHDDSWLTDHGPSLREGLDALSDLITYLKTTTDHNGKPYWNRTLLVGASEFTRSPFINSQLGRDHHLSSSVITAGMGIRGNTVIGGTDDNFTRLLVNPSDGSTSNGNTLIRPPDLHATLLQAIGINHDHLGNQLPIVLEAMLS